MPTPSSPWTDAIVEVIKPLWLTLSSTQICEILSRDHGVTVNRAAVIGKMRRLGIKKPETFKPERPKKQRPVSPPPKPESGDPLRALFFQPRVVKAEPLHISFEQLTSATCKYECSGQDNPQLYTFCGRPVYEGFCCVSHAAIVYIAPKSAGRGYFRGRAA